MNIGNRGARGDDIKTNGRVVVFESVVFVTSGANRIKFHAAIMDLIEFPSLLLAASQMVSLLMTFDATPFLQNYPDSPILL